MNFSTTIKSKPKLWQGLLACILWLFLSCPVSADIIYTIEDGDSAWSVAVCFGVSLDALYEANGWAVDEEPVLQIGQPIVIPSESDNVSDDIPEETENVSEVPESDATTYEVQEGDCASVIAELLGVPTLALLDFNGLTGEDPIRPGQVLNIPPEDYEFQSAFDTGAEEESQPENEMPTVPYEVLTGDTLWDIAGRFHVGLQLLCDINGFTQDTILQVGCEIEIPAIQDQALESRSLAPTAYIVNDGDTLGEIAENFGVSQNDLIESNNLSDANSIREGFELVIPGYRTPPGTGETEDEEAEEAPPEPDPPRDYSNDLEPLPALSDGVGDLFDERSSIFNFGAIEDPEPSHPDLDSVPESGWSVDGQFEDGTPYHIYTIRRGDTLSEVATAFDVTQSALMRWNGLDERTPLRIGRDLRVPLPRPVIIPESVDSQTVAGAPDVPIGTGEGTDIGRAIVEEAVKYLGTPYVWAGSDPARGVDCSGYTLSIMTMFGVDLPHRASLQAQYGEVVEYADLEPGDLVFFKTHRSSNYLGITHSGIYIGNGEFVHASSYRGEVVISIMGSGSYNRNFICARRFF